MAKATPFLMFQRGTAREAIDFYVATVPGSRIVDLKLFGPEGPGPEGTVFQGWFEVAGQRVMVHDTYVTHGFDFTPSWSFYLDCDDEAEIERLFAALGEGGQVMMPLDNYGFSRRFGWLADRFGVSWQVNLA